MAYRGDVGARAGQPNPDRQRNPILRVLRPQGSPYRQQARLRHQAPDQDKHDGLGYRRVADRCLWADVCQQWEDSTKSVEKDIRRVVLRTGLVFSAESGIFPLLKLPFSSRPCPLHTTYIFLRQLLYEQKIPRIQASPYPCLP